MSFQRIFPFAIVCLWWFLSFFLHGFFGGFLLMSFMTTLSFIGMGVLWEKREQWLAIIIFTLSGLYLVSISWSLGPLLFFSLLFSVVSTHLVSMFVSHVNQVTGFVSSQFVGVVVLTILEWYVLRLPLGWAFVLLAFSFCTFLIIAKSIFDKSFSAPQKPRYAV